jgi:hypothetical protein
MIDTFERIWKSICIFSGFEGVQGHQGDQGAARVQ